MTSCKIVFELPVDNAAFEDSPEDAIFTAFADATKGVLRNWEKRKIVGEHHVCYVIDCNGNKCGRVRMIVSEE